MKAYLRRVLRNLFVVCCSCMLLAQAPGAVPGRVQVLAEKTVEALRVNNASFFSTVVDPRGIVIGIDEPPMSASQFKKEIAEKQGVFCVLFDAQSCSQRDFVMAKSSSSLHTLVGQETTVQTTNQGIRNGSQIVSAEVKRRSDSSEVLFTLYFRGVNGRWVLANIDYQ